MDQLNTNSYLFIYLFVCLPGQRLSGAALCGQPGAALAGCGPGLGSCPGWVVAVVEEVGWGPRGPRPCGAGQRTGRGI